LTSSALSTSDLLVKVYGNAIQVSKPIGKKPVPPEGKMKGTRKPIKMYTFKTIRDIKLWFSQYGDKVSHEIMLPYGGEKYPKDIRVAQNHLVLFIRWLKRQGVQVYIWFKEYQPRGAVHFHVLVDRFIPYKELQEVWTKIVERDGFDEVKAAGIYTIKHKDRMGFYVSKYFGKVEQKTIPEDVSFSGRWWASNLPLKPEVHVFHCADRKVKDRLFRVPNKYYNRLLKTWGKERGKKYKRPVRSGGFTVFNKAEAVQSMLRRYAEDLPTYEEVLQDAKV